MSKNKLKTLIISHINQFDVLIHFPA